jgi:hypothetical protein
MIKNLANYTDEQITTTELALRDIEALRKDTYTWLLAVATMAEKKDGDITDISLMPIDQLVSVLNNLDDNDDNMFTVVADIVMSLESCRIQLLEEEPTKDDSTAVDDVLDYFQEAMDRAM